MGTWAVGSQSSARGDAMLFSQWWCLRRLLRSPGPFLSSWDHRHLGLELCPACALSSDALRGTELLSHSTEMAVSVSPPEGPPSPPANTPQRVAQGFREGSLRGFGDAHSATRAAPAGGFVQVLPGQAAGSSWPLGVPPSQPLRGGGSAED
jgi:hypothetical protein